MAISKKNKIEKKTVKIFTDGATVGHNGKLGTVKEVGLGILITESTFISLKSPGGSNNEAEFKALIEAMKVCAKRKVKEATFYLDSRIVANRANGRRPVKAKFKNERMDKFQDEVFELRKKFQRVDFVWVPRERNQVADELSKRACRL